jgi:hypothetical protein
MSTKPLADQVMPGAGDAESASAAEGAVRARDSLFHWCGAAEAFQQTTKDAEKSALLDGYFGALAEESIAPAARYFSGVFFPIESPVTPCVSKPVVAGAIQDLARVRAEERLERDANVDLGNIAADAFAGRLPSGLALSEVAEWGDALAQAAGDDERRALVREMLARLNSLEAQYLVRLIIGELGAVVERSLIEEAIRRRRSEPDRERALDRRKATTSPPTAAPTRRRRRRAP